MKCNSDKLGQESTGSKVLRCIYSMCKVGTFACLNLEYQTGTEKKEKKEENPKTKTKKQDFFSKRSKKNQKTKSVILKHLLIGRLSYDSEAVQFGMTGMLAFHW